MTLDTDTQSKAGAPLRTRRPLLIALGCLLILFLACGIILLCALRPVTAEAGGGVLSADAFRRIPALPLRCVSDLTHASYEAIGTHEVRFTCLGIPLKTTLTVADTTPPRAAVHDLAVLNADSVRPEDFLSDVYDVSGCTASLEADSDWRTRGTHDVRLVLTDGCGNRTTLTARLTVYGVSDTFSVEAGSTVAECAALLDAWLPGAQPESGFTAEALALPGVRDAAVRIDGESFPLRLAVRDTTPPAVQIRSAATILGRPVAPSDFLAEVRDATEVTAAFASTPDVSAPGEREVSLLLTDAAGNETRLSAPLRVYAIPSALTLEAGISQSDALDVLLGGEAGCSLAARYNFRVMKPGDRTVAVRTPDGTFEVALSVRDTTPPSAHGKTVTVRLGASSLPTAADFVENLNDATAVTASFAGTVDFTVPGERAVTVRLTDEAGNKTDVTARLSVIRDTTPPTISGVRALTAYAGSRVSYKSGVTAADNDGSAIAVTVDSSSVKTTVPGVYAITYTATDASGNTASVKTTVTILEITEADVRPYAEKILTQILSPSMTEREKARAIYDWMTANVSYVAYADKTYWLRAAYTGFTTGRGDCYVYYAMSRMLLDCAGIENLEICRDNSAKPHYWNLVNCGDGWYHFDTCPHYKNYPLTSFMLTDREVREYSENCVQDYYSFDASLYPATP